MDRRLKQKPLNIVRVVLYGPESTGKTTLANQLAYHYQTVWVPEYARDYLQDKWNTKRQVCEHEDLLPIAIGQMKLENNLAKKADKVLICDTDLLETKVYAEEYYDGMVDPLLEEAAEENTYDLYLLTYIDVPWEFDTLRDKPGLREKMVNAFENSLKKYNRPYVVLKGDKQQRFKSAVKEIDKIIKNKKNLYCYSESEDIQVTRRKSFFSKFFNFGD
jgi:NadR type nicotinamide-nucleotide adenylyltransferase